MTCVPILRRTETMVDMNRCLHSSMSLPIYLWLYNLLGLGRFFSFLIYTQSVGLLGRAISRRKAATYTQNKWSGIRTHEPSIRASEDSSCLRPRGHCDRPAMSLFS
jgi:hypothetical protein